VAQRRKKAKKTEAAANVEVLARRAGWGTAPRNTINEAQRYSRFVQIMKRALPITAAIITAAVLAYALQPGEASRFAMTFSRVGKLENDLGMMHPRLTGTDDSGQPFTVTADSAMQDAANAKRAMLTKVEADVTLRDGTWINVKSDSGTVDTENRLLDLAGNISIFSDNGYEAHAPVAQIDLKTGVVHGSQTVEAQGPIGTLSADGFEIHRDTKQLYFKGNVHSVFYQSGGKP
jgi:lipopolysaccharide export system protein LptC